MTSSHSTERFYATPRGAVAARLLRRRLALLWPDLRGQSVLGAGHAAPYLGLWHGDAARCIAVSPLLPGAAAWPAGGPGLSCATGGDTLPFPDLSFDRVLLVHGLEAAENARVLLREVWRVLKDDGRLLVVAPNRVGLWAHAESTPFGHGQPYSTGQLGRLLRGSLFRVERRDTAMYVPPTRLGLVLRGAGLWEGVGRRVAPRFAGVTLMEAVKDLYVAIPLRAARRRRIVLRQAA